MNCLSSDDTSDIFLPSNENTPQLNLASISSCISWEVTEEEKEKKEEKEKRR